MRMAQFVGVLGRKPLSHPQMAAMQFIGGSRAVESRHDAPPLWPARAILTLSVKRGSDSTLWRPWGVTTPGRSRFRAALRIGRSRLRSASLRRAEGEPMEIRLTSVFSSSGTLRNWQQTVWVDFAFEAVEKCFSRGGCLR
jgi:hypothetical protein